MKSPTATFYWHCDTKCAVFPQKATIISSVTPLFLSLSLSIYIWMHIGLDILFLWIYDAQPLHIGSLGWKGTNIWKWVQTFKKHFLLLLESVQIEIDSFIHIWYFFFFSSASVSVSPSSPSAHKPSACWGDWATSKYNKASFVITRGDDWTFWNQRHFLFFYFLTNRVPAAGGGSQGLLNQCNWGEGVFSSETRSPPVSALRGALGAHSPPPSTHLHPPAAPTSSAHATQSLNRDDEMRSSGL